MGHPPVRCRCGHGPGNLRPNRAKSLISSPQSPTMSDVRVPANSTTVRLMRIWILIVALLSRTVSLAQSPSAHLDQQRELGSKTPDTPSASQSPSPAVEGPGAAAQPFALTRPGGLPGPCKTIFG